MSVGHLGDPHPDTAPSTKQTALQMVRMLVGLLLGQTPGALQLLNLVEHLPGDQRLMTSLVLGAFKDHHSAVIRIGQHPLDVRHRHR